MSYPKEENKDFDKQNAQYFFFRNHSPYLLNGNDNRREEVLISSFLFLILSSPHVTGNHHSMYLTERTNQKETWEEG